MEFSASSENIHDVVRVEVKRISATNSNSVTFQIKTKTGWKDMTLFFNDHPENAEAFYNALAGMDKKA